MGEQSISFLPVGLIPDLKHLSLLETQYFDILQNHSLQALFQPIVDFNNREIFGYESLIRGPSDTLWHNPLTLFDMARRTESLTELDLLCRKTGITGFRDLSLGGKLFLNTTPQGLLEPGHKTGLTLEFLLELGVDAANVVIELTEQYPMTDFSIMSKALEHYRKMGFEIAIDDLGAGYSSLRRWSELRPEYVKIDRHFIQNICSDSVKRSFVSSIVNIAAGLNCKVIAEGIESREEYQTLLDMGIAYGQGYYFSKPEAHPPYAITPNLLLAKRRLKPMLSNGVDDVADLLVSAPSLSPQHIVEEAYRLFTKDEELSAIAVIDEQQRPLGLIRRNKLMTTFSTHYGRSLNDKKSVLTLTDRSAVIVDRTWSIEETSNLITDNMTTQLEADFIIVENGQYQGLGKVLGLLKKVTDLQIRNARYANPLTLLPGNVPIYEHLDYLISNKQPFTVAYCDLDNFKPYNDVYGYGEGDRVIKLIAESILNESDKSADFVGHVGGDDFIIIFTSSDWHRRCQCILDSFQSRIPEYYNKADSALGGIYSLSREGEEKFFPIMSLSIGVVIPNINQLISHDDIASMASQAKHNAKNIAGNSLYVERRRQLPCL